MKIIEITSIRTTKMIKKKWMCFIMYIDIFIISKLNLNHEINCENNLFFLNLWILYYQNGNILFVILFDIHAFLYIFFYPAHKTCLNKKRERFPWVITRMLEKPGNINVIGDSWTDKIQQYVATERTMT